MLINTDYLVVGAGASGLAFADALVAEADVEVTLIDRRPAPGGHWLRRVPVRPSAYPVGVLRGQLAAARRGPHRPGRRERGVLRTGDGRGGPRVLRRGGRAAHAYRARPRADQARAPWKGRRRRARPRPEHRRAPRCRRSSQGGRRAIPRGVGAGHPHADVRRRAGRTCRTDQRVAGRRGLDLVLHRARVRQDGGRRMHVAVGQRRRAGPRFAGSGPATPGFTTAPIFSRWSRSARSWRASRSTPRPAPRRQTSTTCSSGSRTRAGSAASTRRSPATMYRGTMLSARELQAVRQIDDVIRLGRVRRIEADRIVLERGEVADRPRRSARGLHGARPARRARRADLPARSDRAPAGTAALAVVQRSARRPSSRPTATTTPKRTGSAHPTPTPAASRTGRG